MYDHEELHKINWSFMRRFRFYRRNIGGFWVRSNAFGWQMRQNAQTITSELALCAHRPELYRGGKDIEDYRTAEDFDVHPE